MTQEQALARLNSELSGIMDQALKNQWWNVIHRTMLVLQMATQRFDTILKDPNRFHQHDRAIEGQEDISGGN